MGACHVTEAVANLASVEVEEILVPEEGHFPHELMANVGPRCQVHLFLVLNQEVCHFVKNVEMLGRNALLRIQEL